MHVDRVNVWPTQSKHFAGNVHERRLASCVRAIALGIRQVEGLNVSLARRQAKDRGSDLRRVAINGNVREPQHHSIDRDGPEEVEGQLGQWRQSGELLRKGSRVEGIDESDAGNERGDEKEGW